MVSREASEQFREGFISAFDGHDELTEREDEIHEVENSGELPVDITLQRVVAAYDEVVVWLLNDTGPLQAYYVESEEWGATGSSEEVAAEIEERLL